MGKEHWIKTVEWWFVICGTCPVARSRAVAFISVSPNFIRTLIMRSIKILYLIGLFGYLIKKCPKNVISPESLDPGWLEEVSRVQECRIAGQSPLWSTAPGWSRDDGQHVLWMAWLCLYATADIQTQKQSVLLRGRSKERWEVWWTKIVKPHDRRPLLWRTHVGQSTPDNKIKIKDM